ncbi:MAG: hypothetical protein M5U32_21000 [Myxococcota bacterium]|nr:hypothetical protein [Myxococcota bacterium]
MHKVLVLVAGILGLQLFGAAPAAAVFVRFDIEEISPISALGGNLLFDVGGFEGQMTFEFVDTDTDDILDTGTLVDLRLLTAGPIEDAPTSGFTMTLTLLPGNVDLLQIPDGTEFTFTNALGDPETATALNPVGGFAGDLFTFEPGAALAIEGAPESGIAGCTGDPGANACSLVDPPPPIDLSGPQIPIQLEPEPSPIDKFKFTITGLETVETTPASLTGQFEFFLGGRLRGWAPARVHDLAVERHGRGAGTR